MVTLSCKGLRAWWDAHGLDVMGIGAGVLFVVGLLLMAWGVRQEGRTIQSDATGQGNIRMSQCGR